ncbi:hypothetical protein RB594_002496 [Gaeumannomyces avenae]
MVSFRSIGLVAASLLSAAQALQRFPLPPIDREALREHDQGEKLGLARRQAPDPSRLYREYNLSVPIDHFHNDSRYEPHSDGSFPLRYWFDAQYYKPGGPVIVLGAGETSGVGRLPFLQKGIVNILAKATGGVGVILEHRYYGTSVPTRDFSTENLRFLTTEQALADTAYFAKNVKFPGLENVNLSPDVTPWIAYGGSYAGAFVAFLRKLYPDLFWGAISSSGVPEAIWDYWKYFEAAAVYGPPACVESTRKLTHIVDNILMGRANDDPQAQRLKAAFGMPNITYNDDFAGAINSGIYSLQSYNWDPEIGSVEFFNYCSNVSSDAVVYPATESKRSVVQELMRLGGYEKELGTSLENRFLNYIGYVDLTSVRRCRGSQDGCWGSHDPKSWEGVDLSHTDRLWPYQVCTEWGYIQTGSGAPADQLPLISRLIDLEAATASCRNFFNMTGQADLGRINRYGGFNISYPRLAFVDGEWDPWRAAGVNAIGLPPRKSTLDEPVFLIPKAVHHWDENGVFANATVPGYFPPLDVSGSQAHMVTFVQVWLDEWAAKRAAKEL